MMFSQKLVIKGEKVHLVPYREEHVPTYNRWLQDDEILVLTCSEKLTLEEEYQNQKDCENSRQTLAGDIDIFFDDEMSGGEINVMIAEKNCRRKGLAKEAIVLLIAWALRSEIRFPKFLAKIQMKNAPSIALFENLGFVEVSRSEVFEEITYSLEVTEDIRKHYLTIEKCEFSELVD